MPAIVYNTRYDYKKYRNATEGVPVLVAGAPDNYYNGARIYLSGTKAESGFYEGQNVTYEGGGTSFSVKIDKIEESIGYPSAGDRYTVLYAPSSALTSDIQGGMVYPSVVENTPLASRTIKKVFIAVAVGIVGYILYKKFVKGK